jgi:hypothetical protein
VEFTFSVFFSLFTLYNFFPLALSSLFYDCPDLIISNSRLERSRGHPSREREGQAKGKASKIEIEEDEIYFSFPVCYD